MVEQRGVEDLGWAALGCGGVGWDGGEIIRYALGEGEAERDPTEAQWEVRSKFGHCTSRGNTADLRIFVLQDLIGGGKGVAVLL